MSNDLYVSAYNPDVLSCIANLSNDEVFTPPEVANAMLDMLPQELFSDPNTKFLDPAVKSGVFLREITKRLLRGLEPVIPDLQKRLDHILHNQVYGIAITEMTSLLARRSVYCSKFPNGPYSVSHFDDIQGNIRFKNLRHRWKDGKCVFCGASEKEYGEQKRGEGLESHAYEFIHTTRPEEILKMKFDVIISNPPYQLSTGGAQAQAIPIYQKFIQQAKKLNPRFISMIIPSRWFTGGFGLDSFRKDMVNDKSLRVLHDYLNSVDCFGTGVEIKGGVCYFLWKRDDKGPCQIITHENDQVVSSSTRYLKADDMHDVFIRRNEAVSIFEKVKEKSKFDFVDLVSSQRPFGIPTNFVGHKTAGAKDIVLYGRNRISYIQRNQISKNDDAIDQYKVFITKGYNGGDNFPHQIINKPILGTPGTCCTETYIFIGPFEDEITSNNVISYLQTKFVRFMISLMKNTQDALRRVYDFVPLQDFSRPWTDADLYAKYDLTDDEIAFIESMIKPMELGGDDDA